MSKAEVFIIESLDFDDERKNRFEGRIISDILRLSGKQCAYYYIRTKQELTKILTKFSASDFRYLHLSCHGDHDSLHTTLDKISFQEFGPIIIPHIKRRRLFVSACFVTNSRFASIIMRGTDCVSILGPTKTIDFDDAAILWASFYHVMFKANSNAMKHRGVWATAQEVANTYGVRLTLIEGKADAPKGYCIKKIAPNKKSA